MNGRLAGLRLNMDEGVTVSCRGWSFRFRDREVQIARENAVGGERRAKYVITKEKGVRYSPPHIFRILQKGAITISIDPEGRISMKSFLRKNLPV